MQMYRYISGIDSFWMMIFIAHCSGSNYRLEICQQILQHLTVCHKGFRDVVTLCM